MKHVLLLCAAMLVAGCDQPKHPATDQCLRREIFQQCLKSVPAGPAAVKYNDWEEVVSECGSQAYYQSLRKEEQVKPECKAL